MEQIEINIKLASNNLKYNIPIRKSDTILQLKEYCQILSNIPQAQQILLYNGKILLNEKIIKDYNIENNNNILLVKKEESKTVNNLLFNPDLKDIILKSAKATSNNKEINVDELSKIIIQLVNLFPFLKCDINKIDHYYQMLGFKGLSDIFGLDSQKYKKIKEILKDPKFNLYINEMIKDPSILKMMQNEPEIKKMIQNFPLSSFILQNIDISQIPLYSQYMQKYLNFFKKDEKEEDDNIIGSSGTEISEPPDPFRSLNSSQIMDSSDKISNINTINNNNIINKEIFGNENGIDIDYKEKYKTQLSQLKDMGFINEESNIQALKQSNGDINNALKKLEVI